MCVCVGDWLIDFSLLLLLLLEAGLSSCRPQSVCALRLVVADNCRKVQLAVLPSPHFIYPPRLQIITERWEKQGRRRRPFDTSESGKRFFRLF